MIYCSQIHNIMLVVMYIVFELSFLKFSHFWEEPIVISQGEVVCTWDAAVRACGVNGRQFKECLGWCASVLSRAVMSFRPLFI